MEIIPAIDIIDGRCVRLTQGDYNAVTQYRDLPEDMARRFADHGFRRLHLVDLSGAKAGKPENLRSLEAVANAVNGMVIEWGGGIKTDADVHSCIDAGATCVVAGSIAVREPQRFSEWLHNYGADAMILGADARNGLVAVSGWLEDTDITIDALVEKFLPDGLNQSIVTDIAKDGMLQGPNIDLYARLQMKYPDVTFTVSGGISCIDDIYKLNDRGLRRVIVGKAIYEGRISLADLERMLS